MPNLFKLAVLSLSLFVLNGHAQEFHYDQMKILRNDKEPMITVFGKKERLKLQEKYKDSPINKSLEQIFYSTILHNLNTEPVNCDLNVVKNFKKSLADNDLKSDRASLLEYLKVMRINNTIDDLLFRIMTAAVNDHFNLLQLNVTRKAAYSRPSKELLEHNELTELFAGFEEAPNDLDRCTYQEFYFIKTNLKNKLGKISTKDKDLKLMIGEAHKEDLITLKTYHELNYLRDSAGFEKRDMWLDDYLRVTWRAKNRMIPMTKTYVVKNIEDEIDFSTEKIKRFSKMTRRRLLYRKYDETQIILLSQVLQKASRRMGVDPDTKTGVPVITQEFWVTNEDGTYDNLVERIELDPQSQYNLARRRMRKDIVDLQMMDIFVRQTITYEDVVMAALETGYVTLEDIEYVVKYDDLWNPTKSKFQRVSGFVFNVAGYSSFFLPPPWNIAASIALGVVEGIVDSKNANGANNDNPATFIE